MYCWQSTWTFFPSAALGAADARDREGAPLTLHFAGLGTVKTDIAGKHKIFRRRGPWRTFFAHHDLAEGNSVAIVRLSAYEYCVEAEPAARQAPDHPHVT